MQNHTNQIKRSYCIIPVKASSNAKDVIAIIKFIIALHILQSFTLSTNANAELQSVLAQAPKKLHPQLYISSYISPITKLEAAHFGVLCILQLVWVITP